MTDFSSCIYSPAIRTRRAELLGLSKVDRPFEYGVLPVFELTRSRRTKSNPEGSVEKSVEDVSELVGGAPYVADVTSLRSLTNSDVERLLDPDNCFSNWTSFVTSKLPENAIPVIHLTDPFDRDSVSAQIDVFMPRQGRVALRIPSEFEDCEALADVVREVIGSGDNLAVYVDVGLVTERGRGGAIARVREVASIFSDLSPGLLAPLATSFPSTVTPYGDETGSFVLNEVGISDALKDDFPDLNCIHGDYACIHPLDMEGMAINWVPRVDVPLDGSLFYHRHRRHTGGYVRAAEAALADSRYVALNCWADSNIRAAAAGSPDGKAPAFWISVRLNFHVERQLARLGA
ncbi:hypothetical protein FKV24_006090 [Lysobacter maris]|uniref:Beta protein n=1 Tax=Marilutibacter maris TaxID=1605891 RepID=A0A508B2E5_9GAMM|nr:hypothetical protein [Lysobacter maris]KAB8193907.1 hypothetical protein FKV24_006090 [Lysobacter maris]